MISFRQTRTLRCEGAALPEYLGQPALLPVRLAGEEQLNQLFDYQLDLKTADALSFAPSLGGSFDLTSLVGQEIKLAIELEGRGHFIPGGVGDSGQANLGAGTREISALVVEAHYLREAGRHHLYRLTLRPWLWLATLKEDCRIFQDRSVSEIIDAVLANYPFAVERRLTVDYPKRDYQTQYNESDYAFLARLCEEWGIAWWFEHGEGKHRLILGDHPGAYHSSPSAAYREVSYYPPGHRVDEEHLHQFAVRERLVSATWSSGDRDYTQPRADLGVHHADPRATQHADAEIFHWPNDTSQPNAGSAGLSGSANDPLAEGEHFARVRQQALRARGLHATGQGHVRGLAAGHVFRLARHRLAQANIDWLLLSARLEIEEIGEAAGTEQQWRCNADICAQPAGEIYMPRLTVRRPRIDAGLRATVCAPAGKEMWTDPLGRVKVAFPWDREQQNDERSSCWLRVVSPWAGQQYGGIQVPRAGQEVWVEFEGGDPDRPVLSGRLANQQQLPPWDLPANQALAGFRSKELQGHQANQLILDDSEGALQAHLSSEQAYSQLNLGRITRIPDSTGRADPRGDGLELRSDGHGVIRAGAGLLLTAEQRHTAVGPAKAMAETLSRLQAAQEGHAKLAGLARQHAAQDSGEQDASAERIAAQNKALRGSRAARPESGEFPEFAEGHLALAAPAGIAVNTGDSTHLSSIGDTAVTSGGKLFMTSGKAFIGKLTQGLRLFVHELGMRIVAAHGDIDIRALRDSIHLFAAIRVNASAENIHIAARKRLEAIGGGSYVQLSDGRLELGTAGQVNHRKGGYSQIGPDRLPVELPSVNVVPCKECLLNAMRAGQGLVRI